MSLVRAQEVEPTFLGNSTMFSGNNAVYITLGIPLLMYLAQSVQYFVQQGKYGLALAFVSYAVANVGFILDSKGF